MGTTAEAEARLQRLFARFAGVGAPIWSGDLRAVPDVDLERARKRAVDAATKAGRLELLDDALEFVEKGYAQRVSRDTAWTGIMAVGPSYDGRYRADSQLVLEDLVLAMVVLDVAPESVTEPLRADGERLLRIQADDMESPLRDAEGGEATDDDGRPPVEPHTPPLVFNSSAVGVAVLGMAAFALFAGATIGLEAVIAVVLVFGAVFLLRRLIGT
jgi:hypothetical protein